jgi:hypothetical protein
VILLPRSRVIGTNQSAPSTRFSPTCASMAKRLSGQSTRPVWMRWRGAAFQERAGEGLQDVPSKIRVDNPKSAVTQRLGRARFLPSLLLVFVGLPLHANAWWPQPAIG